MKSKIFAIALGWAVGGALGQLACLPLGIASGRIWFGMLIGATAQAIVDHYGPLAASAPK